MPHRFALYFLAVIALACVVVLTRHRQNDDITPSRNPDAMIGKTVPAISLPALDFGYKGLSTSDLKGRITVVNFFASWCLPCRAEQPLLASLTAKGAVFVGIAYKDKPEDAKRFLVAFGNPYRFVLSDRDGRSAAEFGISGVPETYIVDRNGIIRFRQAGPLTEAVIAADILPLIKHLQQR